MFDIVEEIEIQVSIVVFCSGRSKLVSGTVHQNGFVINNKNFRFFESSQFLYGNVLFLDIQENRAIIPLLPITEFSLPESSEKDLTGEVIEKIALYEKILDDIKEMIKDPRKQGIKEKLAKYKILFDEEMVVYFVQGPKTYKKFRDLPVYVNFSGNFKKIMGKVDSGANIAVIRELPPNAVKNRLVFVKSIDTTVVGPKSEQSYSVEVEINGKIFEIETIVRPNLSYQILLPLSVLGQAGVDLSSITREVALD